MSWRAELEDKYTVTCRKCKREFILPAKTSNQKWAKPGQCPFCRKQAPRRDDQALCLSLTDEEWSEVANALVSKSKAVADGQYNPEDSPGANKRWVKTLDSALAKVTRAFESAGINW
jgi:hypothetical protein